MVELGYESYNSILNLGSLSLFFVYQLFKILFYIFLKIIFKLAKIENKEMLKHLKALKSEIFFTAIFDLMINGCLEYYISGYLQIKGLD